MDLPLIGTVAPWQAVFIVTGAPGAVIALLAFVLAEPRRGRRRARSVPDAPRSDLRELARRRGWIILLSYVGFTLSTLVTYAIAGWMPAYLGRVFAWPASRIGREFGLVVGIGGVLGSILGGIIVDWFSRRGRADAPLLVAALCTFACMPLLIGAFFVDSAEAALLLTGLGFVAFQVNSPCAYATWRMVAPPHMRGRVTVGFVLLASLFGTAVGPLAVGLITDRLFHAENKVGMAVALVLAVTLPLMGLALAAARHAFAKSVARGRWTLDDGSG